MATPNAVPQSTDPTYESRMATKTDLCRFGSNKPEDVGEVRRCKTRNSRKSTVDRCRDKKVHSERSRGQGWRAGDQDRAQPYGSWKPVPGDHARPDTRRIGM